MQQLPRAFAALGSYRQFILCKISVRDGKKVKLPLDYRTMSKGNAHDVDTHLTFNEAQPYLNDEIKLGFVFTVGDPFWFLDLDGCYNSDGSLTPVASYLVQSLQGAAIELSQSGTGLHLIGSGVCPDHSCKNMANKIELYTEGRYVMLTGDQAEGNASADLSHALPFIVEEYFPPNAALADIEDWTSTHDPEADPIFDDEILLAKMLKSASANTVFGNKASFKDLFEANEAVLSAAYPSQNTHDSFDRSSADMAMLMHLAFWTGNNMERMKTFMFRSALRRDKWDREDYVVDSIRKSCASQKQRGSFYRADYGKDSAPEEQHFEQREDGQLIATGGEMSVEEQIAYFDGCVYVTSLNRILMPNGEKLQRPNFTAAINGGHKFQLDMMNRRKGTYDPWVAFTQVSGINQPKVDRLAFRPRSPSREIFEEEGFSYVNSYIPILTSRRPGDPSPFLDLIQRMLPDYQDQQILLSYMSSLVQSPGYKFQYCVLLQGTEGNGKSTIGNVLEHAVGRRYTHRPNAGDLDSQFNGWIEGKLLIIAEEIYMKRQAGGMLHVLKPYITNKAIELQSKGQDQVMTDNYTNWIMMCNEKEAVPVDVDSRRYCVFYTAQQTKLDKMNSGMNDRYWRGLIDWLDTKYGYDVMNEYLHQYQVPDELNPSMISEAPKTTSTMEANIYGRTDAEQEIENAIREARQGFRGGWVSSILLKEELLSNRLAFSYNQLPKIMARLGYIKHPSLPDGRCSSIVRMEKGKPTLYISAEHPGVHLTDPLTIKQQYEKAQEYELTEEAFLQHGVTNGTS